MFADPLNNYKGSVFSNCGRPLLLLFSVNVAVLKSEREAFLCYSLFFFFYCTVGQLKGRTVIHKHVEETCNYSIADQYFTQLN